MRTPLERLTPLDRLMLGASKRWPQDIGALAILDGASLVGPNGDLRTDAVREAIASRLRLVPRFRQVILTPRRGLGGPLWVDASRFDLRDHILVRHLPAGTDEPGLLAVAEELRRERFDATRPLWRIWLLPGLSDGRVALFVKLHHAIADGMAAMATIAALLDSDPGAAVTPALPWCPAAPPSDRDLFADSIHLHLHAAGRALSTMRRPAAAVRHARQAWPAIRELLAEQPATATSLDRMVGPDRTLALIRTTLDDVRAAAHGHEATVNDVVLTLTASGLRAVLRARGERAEGTTLRTYVPISLRPRQGSGGPQQGNVIAQMAVPLPMRECDPDEELRRIAGETAARKARARTSLGVLVHGGRLSRRLLLLAVMRQRVNVTTASIPGPTTPLFLCGAQVCEVFPVLPLIANEPLGVGALSCAGRFTLGVVGDRDTYPDLVVFVAGAVQALRVLGVATHGVAAVDGGAR